MASSSFSRLVNRVEITRECRYAAEKRLARRNERGYYLISMLSLFVIVISVLPNVHQFSPIGTQWLLLITIVNSVFIIINTLIDGKEDYSLRAFQMQQSARDLDLILNKIVNSSPAEREDLVWLREVHGEYQKVLHDCPTDHLQVDYIAVQVNKTHLFSEQWKGQSDALRRWYWWMRFVRLHYARSRWLAPHLVMVVISLGVIYRIWINNIP